jgi:hypothetical protein
MANRSFLKPLSAILAALASSAVSAATKEAQLPTPAPLEPQSTATAADTTNAHLAPGTEREVTFAQGQDLFKFVLARSENGEFVAYHSSHASHSSHDSHSSHSSHSSHYSSR